MRQNVHVDFLVAHHQGVSSMGLSVRFITTVTSSPDGFSNVVLSIVLRLADVLTAGLAR